VGAVYSVSHLLLDRRGWVPVDGDQVIVIHVDASDGAREVAWHYLTAPGRPAIFDQYPSVNNVFGVEPLRVFPAPPDAS
jgi:hypothetical protein